MGGKQMNMASEQHRRAFGKPVKGPPFTAESVDQALTEVSFREDEAKRSGNTAISRLLVFRKTGFFVSPVQP